jgi:F-type H+-transporting ATPase subunit epsilon
MADSFNFELVSPERLLMSAAVTEIILPGTEGEMTVMADHAPTMTTIRPGVLTVREAAGQSQKFVVFGGFADILPSGCTVLAESATAVSDFRKDALARRVDQARADLEAAKSDEARTRISQLIADLGSLSSIAA